MQMEAHFCVNKNHKRVTEYCILIVRMIFPRFSQPTNWQFVFIAQPISLRKGSVVRRFIFAVMFAVACVESAAAEEAEAGDADGEAIMEVVTIYGRSIELIGEAYAASEGTVGYADFEDRPLSRVGELVEVIPGVIATQHSGEGKANQYFLRGFNLDHGTDFSVAVDGTPVNLRSHGHGQGYLDLNFIIPEIVERVDFRKGPYRASNGDFSAAGSARYVTMDRLDHNFVELAVGEFGFFRGVIGVDHQLTENTSVLAALEIKRYDGPWVLEQNLEKTNALVKVNHDRGPWEFEASFRAYESEWIATDQVPLRAVTSGLIDRFGFIDDDLGGETSRYGFNSDVSYTHGSGDQTQLEFYFVDYDFELFSNFTYFLDDPVNGDEFEQVDTRRYYGGGLKHIKSLTDRLNAVAGVDLRYDDITDVGLFRTAGRERLSTVRQDQIEQFSVGGWVELEYSPTDNLRATLGLRGDFFSADVLDVENGFNSGRATDGLFSPSIGLAWQPRDDFEFYANYGRGFHSNDARGATTNFDPVSSLATETVPLLVKADGAELGARWEDGPFRASLAAFYLDLESELVFVGDAGGTEVNDGSRRFGVETSFFWQPVDWFVADISGAWTDAEFTNSDSIPNSVPFVLGGGMVASFGDLGLSARLRHFGSAPLIEDGSARSSPTTLVNIGANYDFRHFTFSAELLNVFDAQDADITYFFESQLAGEPAPVADFHFRPVEPRQFRFSVRYSF
jgi:outer membrane receptor protein involved in Fe transport